eukprot:gene17226-25344_t
MAKGSILEFKFLIPVTFSQAPLPYVARDDAAHASSLWRALTRRGAAASGVGVLP